MPAPPQVILELAHRLLDAERQFKVVLTHQTHSPWSLFWHPDRPLEIYAHAGTRSTTCPVAGGLDRARRKLGTPGWNYAPWTLSDPRGLLPGVPDNDLILTPFPPGPADPFRVARHFVWTGLDSVEVRDKNENLILSLTEFGARILMGRLSITPGVPRLRWSPR